MQSRKRSALSALAGVVVALLHPVCQAGETTVTRTADIIYDRQDGAALTMDEFRPGVPFNGKVIVCIVSGGWYSAHSNIDKLNRAKAFQPFTDAGYKVYAVVHRSAPRFTLEEAYADVTRAIRFIRDREARDGHTSIPLGVIGASAGGHLALLAGTTGDDGDPASPDPIARQPSRVQAVACFFPPTDFLNYGSPGVGAEDTFMGKHYSASISFRRQIGSKLLFKGGPYFDISDAVQKKNILRKMSPITHVTPDDAPALIIHGEKDYLVPIQQSETMVEKLKQAHVSARLEIIQGKGHGWPGIDKEFTRFTEWFNSNLGPANPGNKIF